MKKIRCINLFKKKKENILNLLKKKKKKIRNFFKLGTLKFPLKCKKNCFLSLGLESSISQNITKFSEWVFFLIRTWKVPPEI